MQNSQGSSSTQTLAYIWGIGGGMLASSCCIIQLILNSLTIGCAGFSVLDPYRRQFLALTFGGLGLLTYRTHLNEGSIFNKQWMAIVSTTIVLSSTPEILRLINVSTPNASKKPDLKTLTLDITGMNCESCSNSVKNALKAVDGVVDCSVSREAKTAKVYFQNTRENLKHDLEEAVSRVHFQAKSP